MRKEALLVAGTVWLWGGRPGEVPRLEHIATVPSDGTVIGEIGDVDMLPGEEAVVLDLQARTVLILSREGDLVRTLGGKGQGPGEIGLSREVEVGPDGQIAVVDIGNMRLTMWRDPSARAESVRLDALLGRDAPLAQGLVWTPRGLFLEASSWQPGLPSRLLRVPEALDRKAEQIATMSTGDDGVTCTFCTLTVSPRGRPVVERGDTVYEIAEIDEEGRASRRWRRLDLPAVRRSEEELRRLNDAAGRRAGAEGGRVRTAFSEFKTRFGPHSLDVDARDRLWTAPRVADGAPGFFDVFDDGGTYLGRIDVGVPVRGFRIRGADLVVASESAVGEPVVHLYRIVS